MINLPANRFVSTFKSLLALCVVSGMVACGGGGAKGPTGGTEPGPGGGGTPTTPKASISIALVDPATGAAKSAISSGSPGLVKAVVKDSSGNLVSGTVVIFTTDGALATFSPSSGTALTDSNGQAAVTIIVANVNAAGAASITAKAQVGTESPEGTTAFAIGATSVTFSNLTIGQNPLSAFGTTGIDVTVLSNGVPVTTPLTVNFTSGCAAAGKAARGPPPEVRGGAAPPRETPHESQERSPAPPRDADTAPGPAATSRRGTRPRGATERERHGGRHGPPPRHRRAAP